MTREEILSRLSDNADSLRGKGVLHLALFGSRMRGDSHPTSDLDALVDIDPRRQKFSLVDLVGIGQAIEDLTGIETIVIERSMIERRKDFAQRIADDLVEVF